MRRVIVTLTALVALYAASVRGKLVAPSVFSDGMVLQVWNEGDARSFVNGLADPGAEVTMEVTSSQSGYRKLYTAVADGTTGKFAIQVDGTYIADDAKRQSRLAWRSV